MRNRNSLGGIYINVKGLNNQLDRVICQIKFQPILSVNAKIGSFQEIIKSEYPVSAIKQPMQVVNMDLKDFTFTTEDGAWAVSISMNALSLTTAAYTTWNEFINRFDFLLDAVVKCFELNKIERIGLRYINAIRPSMAGADQTIESLIDVKYRSFVNSDSEEILNSRTVVELKNDDDSMCRSSFGLIHFLDDNESGFLIDNDIISTKPAHIGDLKQILDKYNKVSLDLFKKMTTEDMHRAVGLQ